MRFLEKLGSNSIFFLELYFIYAFMVYKNNFAFIMALAIIGNIILNMLFKGFFIQIGKQFNHTLPLFGSLCRPIDTECKGIDVFGYGTPSGHSQIVAFIAAFYYFYYRKGHDHSNGKEDYSKSKFGILIAMALFTMTTRYTSSMHSIPQILLGGSIGVGIAYLLEFFLIY
jgi:membrane-associated phospholipid phosphatase